MKDLKKELREMEKCARELQSGKLSKDSVREAKHEGNKAMQRYNEFAKDHNADIERRHKVER